MKLGKEHRGTYGFRDQNDELFELDAGALGILTGRVGFASVMEGYSYTDAVKHTPRLELHAEVEWENTKKRCFVSVQEMPGLFLADEDRKLRGTVEIR